MISLPCGNIGADLRTGPHVLMPSPVQVLLPQCPRWSYLKESWGALSKEKTLSSNSLVQTELGELEKTLRFDVDLFISRLQKPKFTKCLPEGF